MTGLEPYELPGERDRVLALLKRFGFGAASFQTLGPDFRYWFADADACLAYVDTGGAWVVGGLPIAPQARYAELVSRFTAEAAKSGRRVRWVTLDPQFAAAAGLDTLCFGEIPLWDPQDWDQTVRTHRSIRAQLRRALAKGVTTRQVATADVSDANGPTRSAMVRLVQEWLLSRRAPPLRFIARVEPFFLVSERRYFAADWHGELIAFLVAVPVYARNGWMIETIFRTRSTPNGVAELLVETAMRSFASSGATYATLGAAPLSDRVNRWMRLGRRLGSNVYSFSGLYAFKAKLKPARWEPIHIAYAHGGSALLAFWDVARAFAPAESGALVVAIARAYRRPVIWLLTLLLMPWTYLLASADTAIWFPTAAIQQAWVAFDLGLIVLFALLLRRWHAGLARTLAALTGLDAFLTTIQANTHTMGRTHGVVHAVFIAVAMLGPLFAAVFLWICSGNTEQNSSPEMPAPMQTP